eukprot:GFYU01011878.1.p1 GENE.GFYU01011878.1~~GFYU01011878.1.p1  ORF type:complete len:494 (-),score=135.70 GFYU01011878.1:58-1539(-)
MLGLDWTTWALGVTSLAAVFAGFLVKVYIDAVNSCSSLPWGKGYSWLGGHFSHILGLPETELHTYAGEAATEKGGMCRMRFLGDTYVTVSDPLIASDVLRRDIKEFTHGMVYDYFKPWLGHGILCSEGAEWKWKRKKMAAAFSPTNLRELFPLFDSNMDRLISQWNSRPEDKTFDLSIDFISLTLDVIGMAAFGFDFDAQQGDLCPISVAFRTVMLCQQERLKVAWMPFWMYSMTSEGKKFLKAASELRATSRQVIANRQALTDAQRAEKTDLLARLMSESHADNNHYTDAQLADEICTLLFAGHESTSTLMMMTAFEVSKAPEVEKKILAELDEVIGRERPPVPNDLPKLTYLHQVLKEVLRLYTPVPGIGKKTKCPLSVDGHNIPAKTDIDLSLLGCHHNPKYWPNPEKFDPDRFSTERIGDIPKNAYIPFATGPRNCVGQNFAMLEVPHLFAKVYQKFVLRSDPDFKLELFTMINTKPLKGIPMYIKKRK